MTDRTKESNQDLEQDDIIELTEVVETASEEPTVEETFEGLEDEEISMGPESADSGVDEETSATSDEAEGEGDVADDDLDFDALFEELDEEAQDPSERVEAEPVDTTLNPEDEGQITGGIHTPDSEEDFDALLEDLDKSDDLLSSLDEPEEGEEVLEEDSTSQDASLLQEEHGTDEIEMEAEEEETQESPLIEEPSAPRDEADEKIKAEEIKAEEIKAEEIEEESGFDLQDLATRLERLENAQNQTGLSEEGLLEALNALPSDAPFWSRVEERVSSAVEDKIREHTQDLQQRIDNLQQRLDQLPTEELATEQSLTQRIGQIKDELPATQDLEEEKNKLRQELQQEIESRIPSEAARIIREEIQNLRSELEE